MSEPVHLVQRTFIIDTGTSKSSKVILITYAHRLLENDTERIAGTCDDDNNHFVPKLAKYFD